MSSIMVLIFADMVRQSKSSSSQTATDTISSSSRKYVFDAYDVEALHYLVKPVDEGKLRFVLKRAVERQRQAARHYMVISKDRQSRIFVPDFVR